MREGAAWFEGPMPDVAALSPATRAALRDDWLLDALFEHASVASFSRLSLELLAAAAPAALLRDVHEAAMDEVRHAELCFALASAYAGAPLEPAGFPIAGPIAVERDLAAIAAYSVVEGCIGETLAAVQAEEQRKRAKDPAVVRALEITVADEIRHAELSFRLVAWAIDVGGDNVRDAVCRAVRDFVPPVGRGTPLEGVSLEDFAAHGRLTADEGRAVALGALAEVVQPCVCALLERPARRRSAPAEAVQDSAA